MIQKNPGSGHRERLRRRSGALRLDRVDAPHQRLILPPHYDGRDEAHSLQFLDASAARLAQPATSDEETALILRQLYGVLLVRKQVLAPEAWRTFVEQCRSHPIAEVLYEDPMTRHAWLKPRGYAGDAELLDYMYGSEHLWDTGPVSELGARLLRCTTMSSACMGVKARRGIISDFIDDLHREIERPHILAFACGHLREAEITASVIRRQFGRFVAADSDPQSLEVVRREYGRFGIETLQTSARETLVGRIDERDFDFIYSSGLCDYLNDRNAPRFVSELYDRLNPGGRLLLTNFVEDIEGCGYMEAFMDWNLIYRNRPSMAALVSRIPETELGDVWLFAESHRNVLFLSIQKPLAQ